LIKKYKREKQFEHAKRTNYLDNQNMSFIHSQEQMLPVFMKENQRSKVSRRTKYRQSFLLQTSSLYTPRK